MHMLILATRHGQLVDEDQSNATRQAARPPTGPQMYLQIWRCTPIVCPCCASDGVSTKLHGDSMQRCVPSWLDRVSRCHICLGCMQSRRCTHKLHLFDKGSRMTCRVTQLGLCHAVILWMEHDEAAHLHDHQQASCSTP